VPGDAQGAYSIYSPEHEPSLRGALVFELKSLVGRTFFSRPAPLSARGPNYLHLGCGANYVPGVVNADFFRGLKPWRRRSPGQPDWLLDLRWPLRCPDGSWDGVFAEHVLEHLQPRHALALLRELRRSMKPGALLRLTVPDLGRYVANYVQPGESPGFSRWRSGGEALRCLSQGWGHVSLWDAELLGDALRREGFEAIVQSGFGEASDPRLALDDPDRAWETLYMEARRP